MPVALDQLRAFDLNPRITRNPNYDEIKESIRHRGLEHPPQITQRPGELFYIIANGGNTRLAILNDLWLETHDKKYWNITCYFRKWGSDQSIDRRFKEKSDDTIRKADSSVNGSRLDRRTDPHTQWCERTAGQQSQLPLLFI